MQAIVRIEELDDRLSPVLLEPGARSLLFGFGAPDEPMFGAFVAAVDPAAGTLTLDFWAEAEARDHITSGAPFFIWYGETRGHGVVLAVP